jgi:UDP-N-acetylmuramoyl-L-alanyl-D-glutamate--2,6-diaminopimelate ligase
MRLEKLLSKIPHISISRTPGEEMDPEIQSIEYDSRKVRDHSLFCAVKGQNTDGHQFLSEVLERGAVAVASEGEAPADFPRHWIKVPEIRSFMALLANAFHGYPSTKLHLIGITGTNGKTTTAYLVHSVLEVERPSLLIGTIVTCTGSESRESERTTPEAIDIQQTLSEALEHGCRTGAVEVSSHALSFKRVYECHFPVAIFTNLSQDHLDFYQTMEEYFQAKRLLFEPQYNPGIQHAVLNGDDPVSAHIAAGTRARETLYGFSSEFDVYPLSYSSTLQGIDLELYFMGRTMHLHSPLSGRHNCYNIMAAATACALAGISDHQIARGIARLQHVPGRFQKVSSRRPFHVFVDYAHTPQALANVLKLCRDLCSGRIICVFGCGGDRDRIKRPQMGRVSVELSDHAIFTTDNPRFESPEDIIDEIRSGVPGTASNFEVVVDRREAITRALQIARDDDLVLIAGKGHEHYQEVRGKRFHFDDQEIVREAL